MLRNTRSVRVLAIDPDLASDLGSGEAAVARERAVAEVDEIDAGPWTPPSLPAEPAGTIGLLVLDGALARDVDIAGIGCTDILGRGDLLHPWERMEGQPSIPTSFRWEALEPVRLAVLDGRFAAAISPWPAIAGQLVARSARVTHSLGVHFAITCFVGLEIRLFLLLWHLADRFGSVGPEGIAVPLRLTHENLARLVRARRPSVTSALGQLADRELVTRRDGAWILHGDPVREFDRLRGGQGDGRELDARGSGEPDLAAGEAPRGGDA